MFLKSQYTIDKIKQIMQLENKPYERIVGYYLKAELIDMFEKGKIKDINR